MGKNLAFRAWFYFRQGWTTYFAFIFAAINTLTVTYFLAIDKYPVLKNIFPSFVEYVVIIASVGLPLLIFIGYAHYKKSSAFKAEADISIEANPHLRRILINTEMLLPAYLTITEMMIKLSKNEKLTESQLEEISKLQKELEAHINNRVVEKT
ncbi:hypothetical protein [Candidatus Nitrosotenuis cloacae]|uniref:hypothetical protein n=1 Tax=Candidatus Nitrosotenuis cloacae TaxID=1603555 RepID=UPI002280587B|nr:hypothetical protein [Candidatus Nitrosotenuis cloacae]